jgi:hypothetical protein
MIRDVHPGPDFLPIPGPVSGTDPGSGSATLTLLGPHLEIILLQLLLRKVK